MIETDTRYRDIENVLNIKPAKKSMKYKILAGIVVISLLAGVGAALYFFVFKDSAGNQSSSSSKPLEKEAENKETTEKSTQTEEGKIDTIEENNGLTMKNILFGENQQEEGKNSLNSTKKDNNTGEEKQKENRENEASTDDDQINQQNEKEINESDQGKEGVILEIVVEFNNSAAEGEQNSAEGEQNSTNEVIIFADQDSDKKVPKDQGSINENQIQEQKQKQEDDNSFQGSIDEIKEREREIQEIVDQLSELFSQPIAWIMDMMN